MTNIIEQTKESYARGNPLEARQKALNGISAASENDLLTLGAITRAYSDFTAANEIYAQLIKLAPTNPDNRNLYATTLSQLGVFDEAEAQLREAIAINEKHAPSYFNLSLIHVAGDGDPLIGNAENFLANEQLSPGDQYAFRLSLGKFYDDLGAFDQAFGHYDAAMKSAAIQYDHAAFEKFFANIKSAFSKDALKESAGKGYPSTAPIFMVGMPRSGSSLLANLLEKDASVAGVGERTEMPAIIHEVAQRAEAQGDYLKEAGQSEKDEYSFYGAEYCRRVEPLANGADHFIDKNLMNFQRLGFIHRALPNAKIINARRDAVDTCLSSYFQTFDPSQFPFTFDLKALGQYYGLYADLMNHWRSVMPDAIIDVDYESVASDPKGVIQALTPQLGIKAKAGAGESDDQSIVATASAWQARQPVYDTSVKRWKNYEKHLGPLLAALDEAGISTVNA